MCAHRVRSGRGSRCGPLRIAYGLTLVIDVQRDVPPGVREKRALVAVPTLMLLPGTAFPPRRLTLRGVSVFELGLCAGPVLPLFQKLSEPEAEDLGPFSGQGPKNR